MNAILNTSAPLAAHDVDALMQGMGRQARTAATVMAAASTAEKDAALTVLARLIREQGEALQTACPIGEKDGGLGSTQVVETRACLRGQRCAAGEQQS